MKYLALLSGFLCFCFSSHSVTFASSDSSKSSSATKCSPVVMIISAPSGTGKTTVMNDLLELYPSIVKLSSVTTRKPRSTERDGVDYKFISVREYDKLLEKGRFFESAEVYGNKYGVLRDDVGSLIASDHDVIIDLDVAGKDQFLTSAASSINTVTIYIMPPSIAELISRLRGRGTDSESIIEARMNEVMSQLKGYDSYDYVIAGVTRREIVSSLEAIYKSILLKRQSCVNGSKRMLDIQEEYDEMSRKKSA